MTKYINPYEWNVEDIDGKLTFTAWCHDPSSERVCVRVKGYKIFSIVKFEKKPDLIREWIQKNKSFYKWVDYRTMDAKTLRYHKTETSKFYKFRFDSLNNYRKFNRIIQKYHLEGHNIWSNRKSHVIRIKIYEDHIDPVTKFLVDRNFTYCQWLKIKTENFVENMTKCKENYQVDYKQIRPVEEKIYSSFHLKPMICAFDIETWSPDKSFPQGHVYEHKVFVFSIVFKRLGESDDNAKKYLLTSLDIDDSKDDYKVEIFKDTLENCAEYFMIERFCELIEIHDPTIITGYNIGGYDIPFINKKIEIFSENNKWPRSIQLLHNRDMYLYKPNWASSAHHIHSTLFEIKGRACIDLYIYVKKKYKLDNYKLETVAQYFVQRGKDPITFVDILNSYDSDDMNLKQEVCKYCVKDSELCIELMEKLNVWGFLTEVSDISYCQVSKIDTRGEQVKILGSIYPYCKKENFLIDYSNNTDDKKYTGAYVITPTPGIYENIATFDFNSMYPNILIQYNICYTTLIHPSKLDEYDKNDYYNFTWIEEINDETVIKSFSFVKPSIRIGILPTVCKNFLEHRRMYRKMINPKNSDIVNSSLNSKQLALKVLANSVYGVLGTLKDTYSRISLMEGAETITYVGRNLIKQVGKFVKDKFNSEIVYGDTDSVMIDLSLNTKYDEYVKLFNLEYEENRLIGNWKIGEKIADEINKSINLDRMRMDLEYMSRRSMFLAKKNYCYWKYNSKGKLDDKINIVGLERRDSCRLMDKMMNKVFDLTIKETPNWDKVSGYIFETVGKFINDEIDIDDLLYGGSIGKYYSSDSTYYMKVFQDRMKKLYNHDINVGERFKYLIVKSENPKSSIGEKLFLYDIYETMEVKPILDKNEYLRKIGSKIDALLFAIFWKENPDNQFEQFCLCGKDPTKVLRCGHKCLCDDCEVKKCPECDKRAVVVEDKDKQYEIRKNKYSYVTSFKQPE